MAWIQADLDALDAEIKAAQSVSSATYADQQVQFRKIEEMLGLRAQMAAAIATASGAGATHLAAFDKGV